MLRILSERKVGSDQKYGSGTGGKKEGQREREWKG